MTIGQLPLPPEENQTSFVWDMVHRDDDPEDKGDD